MMAAPPRTHGRRHRRRDCYSSWSAPDPHDLQVAYVSKKIQLVEHRATEYFRVVRLAHDASDGASATAPAGRIRQLHNLTCSAAKGV